MLASPVVDRDLLRRKLMGQVSEYRDLGRVMVQMTGFRNVIVHEYAQVDADAVIRILQGHLEDFRRFEAEALRWL
jgi:uncharacterized protein YutE (UPF0331/DUF86 family)